jgi:hypothetical protein
VEKVNGEREQVVEVRKRKRRRRWERNEGTEFAEELTDGFVSLALARMQEMIDGLTPVFFFF